MTSKSNQERLAVLEEKTDGIDQKLDRHIQASSEHHRELISRFDSLDARYVTKERFTPVEKVVYGLVGAVLMSVLGGLLALVIRKG